MAENVKYYPAINADGTLRNNIASVKKNARQDLALPTTVDDTSDLFSSAEWYDGALAHTKGYTSAGGVGENRYRYDAGSSATIDGGFVLPGVGGTLSFSGATFNGTAGTGRWIAVERETVKVEQFGAVCDGSTDDSSAMQRAANTGKYLILPKKTIKATWSINPSSSSLRIVGNGTRLTAANANEFALTVTGSYPGGVCSIEGIDFYGANPGKDRHGLQMTTGSVVFIDKCWFSYCGIGLCNNRNISSRYTACFFRQNYLGLLITTRTASSGLTVADINGQTVTLSDSSPYTGQPGELHICSSAFDINDIACVIEQPGNTLQGAHDVVFDKTLLQSGTVGIYMADDGKNVSLNGPVMVRGAWCEGNDATSTVDFDGTTLNGCDYLVDRGTLVIDGGNVQSLRVNNTARVRLDNVATDETFQDTSITKASTASITGGVLSGDNENFDFYCQAVVPVVTEARSVVFKTHHHTSQSYALKGSTRLKNSYTCLTGDFMSTFGGTNLGTITDGTLSTEQCQGHAAVLGNGVRGVFTSTSGNLYAATFAIKAYRNARTFTADATTDVLTSATHGFQNGQAVLVSSTGSLPAGLSAESTYYIVNKNAGDLQLSTTVGGAAVDITDAGTGTHTIEQVNSFSMRISNEGTGCFTNVKSFTITSEWQTYAVAGYAASGGTTGNYIIGTNDGGSVVRAFLMSAVQVVECANTEQLIQFFQSEIFYVN